jgi:hypothetical protein
MTRRSSRSLFIGFCALLFAGCTTTAMADPPCNVTNERGIGHLIYLASQNLVERPTVPVMRDRPIVVTTAVNVNDLDQSSTFGRLVSQLVASRLVQLGYLVRDVTYAHALSIKPETGELVLSRDLAKIGQELNAQAVVAASYAVIGNYVYLNIRLLRAEDGAIVSAKDVVIPQAYTDLVPLRKSEPQ